MKNADVVVFGLGYVGLPTAIIIAQSGKRVLGVDVDSTRLEYLRRGTAVEREPGLAEALDSALASENLRFSEVAEPASIYVICVPTPVSEGRADLTSVLAVVSSLAPLLEAGDLVILESTSPVGATELVRDRLSELGVNVEAVDFAYCPERVLPGDVLREIKYNPRIVGGLSASGSRRAQEFYESFAVGEIYATAARVAELAKLVENSFRDVNIAFANEVSLLASSFGVSDRELIELVNLHPRVNVLQPGVGVGGHCVAVDPLFLVESRPHLTNLIRTAREVNDAKGEWVVNLVIDKVASFAGEAPAPKRHPTVLCLGLTYKPDSSDLRSSRALHIFRRLKESGVNVLAVDPNIEEIDGSTLPPFGKALQEADIVLALVRHTPFEQIDFSTVSESFFMDFCGLTSLGTPLDGRK